MVDIGDFAVSGFGLEFARDKQETRSDRSKEADRERRAPITTDAGVWANNKDELDYPGIDTPTENPKVLPKDLKHPSKTTTSAEVREEAAGTGALQISSAAADKSQLAAMDISLSPDEAFRGVGTGSHRTANLFEVHNYESDEDVGLNFEEPADFRPDI